MKKTVFYLLIISFLYSCSSSKIVYCGPDKTRPVLLYKKPNHHYKEFVKTFEFSTKSALDVISGVDALDVDLKIKNNFHKMRDNLNNNSIRINDILFRAAEVRNTDVCNEELSKQYFELLSKLTDQLVLISQTEISVSEVINASNAGQLDEGKLKLILDTYNSENKI